MSDKIKVTGSPTSYTANLPKGRRYAVQTAVELIHAHASSGCSLSALQTHIDDIGKYADAIEKALKSSGDDE